MHFHPIRTLTQHHAIAVMHYQRPLRFTYILTVLLFFYTFLPLYSS